MYGQCFLTYILLFCFYEVITVDEKEAKETVLEENEADETEKEEQPKYINKDFTYIW